MHVQRMHWVVLGVVAALLAVAVVVNSVRVQRLRDDVDSIPREFSYPDTESLVVIGSKGITMPKTAYWLKVKLLPSQNNATDMKTQHIEVISDNASDSAKFITDVESSRIKYVYLPEGRIVYLIGKNNGKYEITSTSSAPFIPEVGVEVFKTIIGLPDNVVTNTA